MSNPTQDAGTFQNPSGYWGYEGPFSVELIPEADKSIAPPEAMVRGDVVYVTQGRVAQVMGGIQLFCLGKPFFWGYKFLKAIRDGQGNLLWVNTNYT